MTAMPARKLEESRLPSADSEPPRTAPLDLTLEAATSPVAAMQHRLQEAALLGFFDKPAPPPSWRGHYRALATCGVAIATWSAVFAAVWALSK